MKQFFKKHIGIAVLLIIVLTFPVSLSTQARLNMRVIVTGLAIDKSKKGYEVTAQIVKTQPSGGGEENASIEFISEQGETIVSAISKLSYKSGKVAGFSHTNFILLGKSMLEDNLIKSLDYFLRDTTIKDSALLVVAKDVAKDELQKTKDLGLSVGLGIQKVFVYKEKESDGTMTTLLDFVNNCLNESKTATISNLEFIAGSTSSEESESQEGSSNEQTTKSEGQEESKGSSESGGSEEKSSQNASGSEPSNYFKSQTPINCFVGGKYVGMFEGSDEIAGFMFARNKCKSDELSIENVNFGNLKNAKIGIDIKFKTCKKRVRFEGELPVLDIVVNVEKSTIREIQNEEFLAGISDEEFEHIKKEMENAIAKKIAVTFDKSKEFKADVFGVMDYAYKFKYKLVNGRDDSMEDMLEKTKLNVEVNVNRLEY